MIGQRVVYGFDEGVLVDEVTGPFGPRRENPFLLHLIDDLFGGHGFLNGGGCVLKHLDVGADVVEIGELAVPGDNFDVGGKLRDSFLKAVGHALDAAAAGDGNGREALADEVVAHVNEGVSWGKDDGVAVGGARGRKGSADG